VPRHLTDSNRPSCRSAVACAVRNVLEAVFSYALRRRPDSSIERLLPLPDGLCSPHLTRTRTGSNASCADMNLPCSYIARVNVDNIKQHLRKRHRWMSSHGRGRLSSETRARSDKAPLPYRENVPCQRLFPGGVCSTCHAVKVADSDIANVSLPCSGSGDNVANRLDRELDRLECFETADARLRSTGASPSRQSSPWLDLTRCVASSVVLACTRPRLLSRYRYLSTAVLQIPARTRCSIPF